MIAVTVMYPQGPRFNLDYYLHKHIPLVKQRWTELGMEKLEITRGIGAPGGGDPAFQIIALLSFASLDDFNTALARHGAEIIGDIQNFTGVQPILQISEPLSS